LIIFEGSWKTGSGCGSSVLSQALKKRVIIRKKAGNFVLNFIIDLNVLFVYFLFAEKIFNQI
jgi:hypothetical protein